MRTSLTFGKVAGIPLRLHLNWFITAVLVAWSLAGGYFPQEYPGWARSMYWAIGGITALFFFLSVLLHEIGHALIAQRENVEVNSITLFIFGGVASIAHEPETPGAEFRIVAAGPLTSLLLAVAFSLISEVAFASPQVAGAALYLSRINVILAVFNLIPGFPLDGGRILRAILWRVSHNFLRATRWASNTGLGIALLFVAAGIILITLGNFIAGSWLAFIGWYLSTSARQSYQMAVEEYAGGDFEGASGAGSRPTWAASDTVPVRRLQPPQPADASFSLGMSGKHFALVRVVEPGEPPFTPLARSARKYRSKYPFPEE